MNDDVDEQQAEEEEKEDKKKQKEEEDKNINNNNNTSEEDATKEEQRGDSAKESCRPTRTNTVTDRPRDAKRRDETPKSSYRECGNGKPRGRAQTIPDRGDQDGRSITRPDSTD